MIRRLLLTLESAVLLVSIMFAGSLVLWVGVPVGWLWVGSQIQTRTGSLTTALGAMMGGTLVTVALFVVLLGWLNRKHIELREARGQRVRGATVLEQVMVASAVVAVVAFGIWFFGFSGTSPLPLNISY